MYQWVEALGYEIRAAGRNPGKRRTGLTEGYRRGAERLGATAGGARASEWVRSVGKVVSTLPVLTWQADTVTGRHGIHTLTGSVRTLAPTDPAAGVAAIRLAEGIDAVRIDRLALRSITMFVNPAGALLTTSALAVAELGAGENVQRTLVRRAHRIAACGVTRGWPFDDVHTLARVYLAADKPRHALQHAYRAAQVAKRAAESAPRETAGLRDKLTSGGWRGAGDVLRRSASEAVAPTYASLSERAAWQRRCGAALVTAAWAHLRLGELDRSEEVARRAISLGNSLGHLPLAALLPATGGSVRARVTLIEKVEDRDRREYSGVSRGDAATVAHMTAGQGRKAARLVQGAAVRVRGGKPATRPEDVTGPIGL